MTQAGATILIIGAGDLGLRISVGLSNDPLVREIVIAGRRQRGSQAAALLNDSSECPVRFRIADALNRSEIERLLKQLRPDLVIQCASLLSPWYISGRDSPAAAALRCAGFAAQLPAQLPIVRSVMEAVREVGFNCPVVNCSFPDLTHPILKCAELAPTIGAGNAAMIWRRIRSALRSLNSESVPLVRVVAHHVHVTSCILSQPPQSGSPRPRVFLEDSGRPAHDIAYMAPPLTSDRSLNALSAASSLPVIRSLLPGGAALRISTPAPFGLPGGYPVRIGDGVIDLDLPDGVELDEVIRFQHSCGRMDGVERILPDGTVAFTEEFRAIITPFSREMAEPLAPQDCLTRFQILKSVLGI